MGDVKPTEQMKNVSLNRTRHINVFKGISIEQTRTAVDKRRLMRFTGPAINTVPEARSGGIRRGLPAQAFGEQFSK